MILLWGPATDGPLAAVRAALHDAGAAPFLLDQARSAATMLEFDAGRVVAGEIRVDDERCALADVSGIYVRCHSSSSVTPAAEHDAALARHGDRLDDLMSAFLDVTDALVLNPNEAMATNGSKPFQAKLIAAHGFNVPDTLITTSCEALNAFVAQHGEVIFKSTSSIRSIVRKLRSADSDRLADLAWCPTQFQQHIPGRDYRVHVVGNETFVAEIVSDADDYRFAAAEDGGVAMHASRIPGALEERCRSLAASLGLPVAGIDLRLTPQGEWYCFEVNPSPAFTFYTAPTRQPIAAAIARLLLEAEHAMKRSGEQTRAGHH